MNDHDPVEQHEKPTVLLIRLEERVKVLATTIDRMEQVLKDYVTRIEFAPVKLLTFGIAGLILSAVVAALVAGVLRK